MKITIIATISAIAAASAALILTPAAITLAAPAHADNWTFDICPSGHEGVGEGSPTTCPFAENVHNAWYAAGQPLGSPFGPVWSPVTVGHYTMECNGEEPLTGVTPGGLSTRCEDIPDTGVRIVLW